MSTPPPPFRRGGYGHAWVRRQWPGLWSWTVAGWGSGQAGSWAEAHQAVSEAQEVLVGMRRASGRIGDAHGERWRPWLRRRPPAARRRR